MSRRQLQTDVILRHLKRSTITQAQAWDRYAISRLASVIADLRADGVLIATEMLESHSVRYGATKYARYRLDRRHAC